MLDEIINVNQIWALQASHILIVVLFQVAFLILSPFPDSTWNVDSHAHALLANVFFWYVDILLVKSFFSITYSISTGGFQPKRKQATPYFLRSLATFCFLFWYSIFLEVFLGLFQSVLFYNISS